ncbi:MAG: alkaline phosphatase family protein [Vulcanimicrobiaceae bacterium]
MRKGLSFALLATFVELSVTGADAGPHRLTIGGQGAGPASIPTGQFITPTSAPGSTFFPFSTGLRPDDNADAAEAVATALSPDGTTMLVLTSGYNQNFRTVAGAPIVHPVLDPISGAPSAVTTPKSEWVFVYDVTGPTPTKIQQIGIPDTYNGIVWDPSGKRFFVSGGISDRIMVYASATADASDASGASADPLTSSTESRGRARVRNVARKRGDSAASDPYKLDAPFILLGHNTNETAPVPSFDGGRLKDARANVAAHGTLATGAVVAGLAISRDGSKLFAANMENDSLSTIDTATRKVDGETQLSLPRAPRGEYPFWVAVRSAGDAGVPGEFALKRGARPQSLHKRDLDGRDGSPLKVYVSSLRDAQVVRLERNGGLKVIPVGDGPNKMILSGDEHRLYVANGNSDSVSVIDTDSDTVLGTIPLSRPGDRLKGANPNSLALSPDQRFLFVTLGGENAVAMVDLASLRVIGRIPTGWYPNSVTVSADGKRLFIVNGKSNAGPSPSNGRTTAAGIARNATFRNEYSWALEKAGLLVVPMPDRNELAYLTRVVDANDGFDNRRADPTMTFLRSRIKHVIYVVKENRTYDEVLGDLPAGAGDPSLTLFPQAITPNHHALAANFVTLDHFFDSAESSGVGWNWTTAGHTTDYIEKSQSVLYGNANFNGLTYDYEGPNRNVNVSLPDTAASNSQLTVRNTTLLDPSLSSAMLPGPKDVSATVGADDPSPSALGGYLWDTTLRAGKTVRNYGHFVDLAYYGQGTPLSIPLTRHPFDSKTLQSVSAKVALRDKTDIYFRGYDNAYPDRFRYEEWKREFDGFVKDKNLPSLSLVRLMHDHFGAFGNAIEGLNTPQLQMADNDYALGSLVEAVSSSPYWADTAIFVIEDDAQDGPDHIDSHRSLGYVISAYTKRKALVSTTYTTVNMLRTMEDLLGARYLGMNDANALPMSDVFTGVRNLAPYNAIVPGSLCAPPVNPDLIPECSSPQKLQTRTRRVSMLHDGAWWADATKGMNFSVEDAVDPVAFNAILERGINGDGTTHQ